MHMVRDTHYPSLSPMTLEILAGATRLPHHVLYAVNALRDTHYPSLSPMTLESLAGATRLPHHVLYAVNALRGSDDALLAAKHAEVISQLCGYPHIRAVQQPPLPTRKRARCGF
jgi:hypothetical protein